MTVATMAKNPSSEGLKIETVTITPAIAEAWLDKNVSNRRISDGNIRKMTESMRSGHWRQIGDSIKFSASGRLIDGQHRLKACIEADLPFVSLVVYGIDDDAQSVIDAGKSRTSSDVVSLHGIGNSHHVAKAYKILAAHRKKLSHYSGGNSAVSNGEMSSLIRAHPKLPLYVPYAGSFPRGISLGMVGFVNYVGSVLCGHRPEAESMMLVLKTGNALYPGDAMHAFRERALRGTLLKTNRTGRSEVIFTFKYCWNNFCNNNPVQHLKIQSEDCDISGLNYKDL